MAWVAFLAFFVVFGASIAYLRTGNARWDRLGRASAEVGVVFTTLVLITGSIWGYPIWGTWWSWDPKLTTTLILWFMYLAYLMVRSYAEPPRGPRFAAVVGIVAFFDVPIVYLSSYWWRTLHPPAGHRPARRAAAVGQHRLAAAAVAGGVHRACTPSWSACESRSRQTEAALALRARVWPMLGLDHNARVPVCRRSASPSSCWRSTALYLRSRLLAQRRRRAPRATAYSARNVSGRGAHGRPPPSRPAAPTARARPDLSRSSAARVASVSAAAGRAWATRRDRAGQIGRAAG